MPIFLQTIQQNISCILSVVIDLLRTFKSVGQSGESIVRILDNRSRDDTFINTETQPVCGDLLLQMANKA